MRVLPETKDDVRVPVELTGRELQLAHRALLHIDSSNAPKDVQDEEYLLLREIESLLDEYGLEYLDA